MQKIKPWLAEICLAFCVISTLPLLVAQSVHLWDRPHFQFFPLAWLSFGYLVTKAGKPEWTVSVWRQRLGIIAWSSGIVAVVTAALFFSPWIGQASAILCICGWGLLRLNSVPLFRWLGWTFLLWITLPLPGNLDGDVVNGLQRLSAQSASNLLDLLGILHLRQGTLLEIRSRQLFVDEACSGIDSLYSLIAISTLMILWQRRPLVIGLLTLVTVPLWAWLGNVLRLLVIVYLLDRWQVDLSSGWPHTVLGLVTFTISSLCLLVTLNGLATLFQRFSNSQLPEDMNWHLLYNAIVCFPDKPPEVITERDQYFAQAPSIPESPSTQRFSEWVPNGRFAWAMLVVCLFAMVFNVRSTSRDWMDGRSNRLPHYELAAVESVFRESDFPEVMRGAKRKRFQADHRTPESYLGEYSRSWTFQDSCCDFVLSLDFPFRGYHPLWVCYINAGNQVQGAPMPVPLLDGAAPDKPHVVHVKLRDDLGNYSYLWFELFDQDGVPVPIKTYDQPAANPWLTRLQAVMADTVARDPVSYQLQLLVPSSRELTQPELDSYAKFFEESAPIAKRLVKQLP